MEEGPELGEVVLKGRASEEQLVGGGDALELADQLAVEVLQAMALVHDKV